VPAVLTDRQICSTRVPIQWRELLIDLEKFLEVECDLHDQQVHASPAHTPPYILSLHARLMSRSAALLEPDALQNQTPQDDARLFARATLMLMRLRECVAASDHQRLDTAGSRILGDFQSDVRDSAESLPRLRRALASLPQLEPGDLAAIEADVERDVEDARRKQRVVAALRSEFQLWPGAANLRDNIWNFFSACYPDSGLRPDEVELIVTGCVVFFCIPFAGTQLLTDRFRLASDDEQAAARLFLTRATRFAHWQFANFPVFGCLQGESLPPDLLQRLAAAAELTVEQTSTEISRLISIVPLHDVDKYVPHDVWGHSWQASMLHYDNLYEELATYALPLSLTDTAPDKDGCPIGLADCFSIVDGHVELVQQAFVDFAQALVLHRLPIALTPVLAELIADMAEFKFVELEPTRAVELPNSSLLQAFPSKLDLMMDDVFFYFRQATKALRLWAQQPQRQRQTVEELMQWGATSSSAEYAVAQAVAIWRDLESDLFAGQMHWSTQDGQLRVNVIVRVALNFLGIHRATLDTYQRIRELDAAGLPLRGFRDLMLLAAAVFFEADPPRNLWRVDEFISLRIVPWCESLARAMQNDAGADYNPRD
jgi:hypothetical protein